MSVRQLEAAGLVVRSPSATDGRAVIVELSPEGRALIPKLKAAWIRVAEQTVAGLDSTSAEQLGDMLKDLATGLAATEVPAEDVPRYVRRPDSS